MTLEKLKVQLDSQSLFANIEDLYNQLKALKTGKADANQMRPRSGKTPEMGDMEEMVDAKMQQVYERLRNDNWLIWKESLRLAEHEFSEDGIKKTMNFLPKVVYDRDDLKREINSLMMQEDQTPRPVVKVPK